MFQGNDRTALIFSPSGWTSVQISELSPKIYRNLSSAPTSNPCLSQAEEGRSNEIQTNLVAVLISSSDCGRMGPNRQQRRWHQHIASTTRSARANHRCRGGPRDQCDRKAGARGGAGNAGRKV